MSNQQDNPPGASTCAESVAETTKWVRNLVAQKSTNSISPLTENRAMQILAQLEDIKLQLSQPDDHLPMISTLKEEMAKRIDADEKHAECRLKLEKLARDSFYIRYGDYYETALSPLRIAAQQASTAAQQVNKDAKDIAENRKEQPQPSSTSGSGSKEARAEEDPEARARCFFMKKPWVDIDKALRMEEQSKDVTKVKWYTKLLEQLVDSANLPGVDFMRSLITLYTTRNDLVHRSLNTIAQEGYIHDVSNIITEDLQMLGTFNFWEKQYAIPEEHLNVTKDAILKTASLYFQVFDYDERATKLRRYVAWPQNPDGTFNRSDNSQCNA